MAEETVVTEEKIEAPVVGVVPDAQTPPIPEAPVDPYAAIEDIEEARQALRDRDQAIADAKARMEQQETFIQQKKQQLGEAEKHKRELEIQNQELAAARQKAEELKENVYSDPEAYANAHHEVLQKQEVIQSATNRLNESVVLGVHSDFSDLLSTDIPEVLKQDGFTDAQVEQFKANWRVDPQTAVFFADKAKMHRENKGLRRQLEEAKGNTGTVANKILNAGSLTTPVTGAPTIKTSTKAVEQMTRAERDAEYAELVKKGILTPRS